MSFTQHRKDGLVYYSADPIQAAGGVVHGFSTRIGGVSRGDLSSLNLGRSRDDDPDYVKENHRRFSAAIGSRLDNIVMCQQVHSDIVCVVTQEDALSHLYDLDNFEADGLVTNCPNLVLTVFYADCIPILLYDPVHRAIGAVHSGWRGTSMGIVKRAVETMGAQYGSHPADILAAIGPGIGPECFETHNDVPDAMAQVLGIETLRPFVRSIPEDKFLVDLKGIIALQLRQSGLTAQHITVSELCTACNLDLFWSHRKLGERRGNQAAMIQLLGEDQ